jgi:hypothetical protein
MAESETCASGKVTVMAFLRRENDAIDRDGLA